MNEERRQIFVFVVERFNLEETIVEAQTGQLKVRVYKANESISDSLEISLGTYSLALVMISMF